MIITYINDILALFGASLPDYFEIPLFKVAFSDIIALTVTAAIFSVIITALLLFARIIINATKIL